MALYTRDSQGIEELQGTPHPQNDVKHWYTQQPFLHCSRTGVTGGRTLKIFNINYDENEKSHIPYIVICVVHESSEG